MLVKKTPDLLGKMLKEMSSLCIIHHQSPPVDKVTRANQSTLDVCLGCPSASCGLLGTRMMEKCKEFRRCFTRAKANPTFTAVAMVCLYSKVITDHKPRRTGGQQVGENRTDGGTMLMKRARETKKKKSVGTGRKEEPDRRGGDGREAKGGVEEVRRRRRGGEERFISMTS